jgi:hypothetical protein
MSLSGFSRKYSIFGVDGRVTRGLRKEKGRPESARPWLNRPLDSTFIIHGDTYKWRLLLGENKIHTILEGPVRRPNTGPSVLVRVYQKQLLLLYNSVSWLVEEIANECNI